MLPAWYSSWEEDVEACTDVGIGGLAIWPPKLGIGNDGEVIRRMNMSGLKAACCSLGVVSILPESYFGGPTDPDARVAAMCAAIDRLSAFSPSGLVALTGGADRPASEARRIVVEGFREVGRTAAKYGLKVGIEPVRYPEGTSLVSTLREAAELVEEIGSDSVGITFDVWHHWDSPTLLADIQSLIDIVDSVQIADWRDPPRGKMDRVLPGEGPIDLARIVQTLEQGGYSGWYELEVFSDETFSDSILRLDERELLRRGLGGFERAWAEATH
jgi:sugar phosphate isomerase/epimerase